MQVSDFTHSKTTHELLIAVFASEIGLSSVTAPAALYQGVADSFKSLQTGVLDNLRAGVTTFELKFSAPGGLELAQVQLTYRNDAHLFQSLYKNFNQFDEDEVITQHVFPLIGALLGENLKLRAAIAQLLEIHVRTHGPAVGTRICKTLSDFDLDILIPALKAIHP